MTVISPFREDFIFTKLRICEVSLKLNPRENFRIYSKNMSLNACKPKQMKKVTLGYDQEIKKKIYKQSKEEGKGQESIHSSTTPDPGNH